MSKPAGVSDFEGLSNTNLICAFSSRQQGNMSLIYGDTEKSLNNRKMFLDKLGINYQDLICAKQIHHSNIGYVKIEDKGKGALTYDTSISGTDAFITDIKNLPLAIFTADCLSIFLYDSKKAAVGLVHAGWQSTRQNIVTKTIQLMQEKFNTQSEDLQAGFGPAIRDCCYIVGDEFKDYFALDLIKRNGRYYLDLAKINKNQLLDLGVKEKNIFDSGICTSCQNQDFFSYRKEGNSCGRIMSVIMLR